MRASLRLAALTAVAALAASLVPAPAAAAPPAGIRAIARSGETAPWIYAGATHLGASAPAEPKARALAIVHALAPHTAGLELVSSRLATFGDGDRIVRFEQTHQGLPVLGRGATVRMNARGESVLGTVRVETDLPASITPSFAAESAARAAARYTAVAITPADAHLVILPTRTGARLAWAVTPLVPAGLPTSPRVMVDAQTGRVLEARDLVVFMGQGKVYETNPVTSPTLVTKTLEIAPDSSGNLANDFVQSANCVDNQSVKQLDFSGIKLNVHVCDMEHLATHDASGDFLYDPLDDASDGARKDAFSEVSMYHHASKVYSFFRGLQGDPTAQVVVDKPLRTISNLQLAHGLLQGNLQAAADPKVALDPFQNAFFAPASDQLGQVFQQLYGFTAGAMWFGQGPLRDYSYDGDVVYHEFTHAVVDDTLQLGSWHLDKYGLFDAPGAMNEGLADYFSSALAGDPNVGEYASKDISSALTVIRTLDNTDACPSSIQGEVHWDSTLFSGGLWKARASLAEADRSKFDAALYKAMRSHAGDGDVGYEDVVNLFLATLQTDLPAGATALTAEMTTRGVLPGCTRIYDGAKTVSAPPAGLASPGNFAAPGTSNLTDATVAPGMIQVKLDLADGQGKLDVKFVAPVAQQSAAGALGGAGTPFTPVALAKFGAPIEWTTTGVLKSDATSAPATSDGNKTLETYTASFDIPAGAKVAYVQIANSGESDGSYNAIALTTEAAVVADAGAPPASDAGTGAAATPGPTTTTASAGCGCSVPRSSTTGGGLALAGLAALAMVGRRRRATRQRG